MRLLILILIFFSFSSPSFAQKVGVNTNTPQFTLDVNGETNADKYFVKEGMNASVGEATLVNGVAEVFTNKVNSNSKIFITYKKPIFTSIDASVIYCPSEYIVDNTSFIIKSELIYPEPNNIANEGNNSEVYWWIIN